MAYISSGHIVFENEDVVVPFRKTRGASFESFLKSNCIQSDFFRRHGYLIVTMQEDDMSVRFDPDYIFDPSDLKLYQKKRETI